MQQDAEVSVGGRDGDGEATEAEVVVLLRVGQLLSAAEDDELRLLRAEADAAGLAPVVQDAQRLAQVVAVLVDVEWAVERDVGIGWELAALALCSEQLRVGLEDARCERSVIREGDWVDTWTSGLSTQPCGTP